jgi:cyanophycinase-like exopeptidase
MGLPRYIAAASSGDLQRLVWLAEELRRSDDNAPVALVQCGPASPQAAVVAHELKRRGRQIRLLVLDDREKARAEQTLAILHMASAAWVFADDLLSTFYEVFATPAAFALRERAAEGLPVIGVGGGALALGSLLHAGRVCSRSRYDLVTGLAWAPRVLIDADIWHNQASDARLTQDSVRTLPGLLGLQLGASGGVRVEGGRVESIGDEPVMMLGMDHQTGLLQLRLQPGAATRIAPPPFAPFERRLLPASTLHELSKVEQARLARLPMPEAPPPPPAPTPPEIAPEPKDEHERPGSGRTCPLCRQLHTEERIELAA